MSGCFISVALSPMLRTEVEHRMAKYAVERYNMAYSDLPERLQESIFHKTAREVVEENSSALLP
jgi:hypothetical protein